MEVITEEVPQESCCCFHSMSGHLKLLNPENPIYALPAVN